MSNVRTAAVLAATILSLAAPAISFAQDDATEGPPKIWYFTAEVSGVWAAGNTQSATYGLDFTLEGKWPKSLLKFTGGSVQTEATLTTRTATGTVDDFQVQETSVTEKTAELYYFRGRYDYNLSKKFFLFGGAGWLRNIFSGIDSRFLIAAGAGNTWTDTEKAMFQTVYSVTYTFQQEVVENPFTNSNFPGVLVGYDLMYQLTQSTQLTSDATFQLNLDNTEDIWVTFNVALPISISETFFFKPAWQLIWRNQPALTDAELFDGSGNPIGTVAVPLQKADSFFLLSLVVKL